jgi:hypothetical protein
VGKTRVCGWQKRPQAFSYVDEPAGAPIRTLRVGAGTGLPTILLGSKPR